MGWGVDPARASDVSSAAKAGHPLIRREKTCSLTRFRNPFALPAFRHAINRLRPPDAATASRAIASPYFQCFCTKASTSGRPPWRMRYPLCGSRGVISWLMAVVIISRIFFGSSVWPRTQASFT